jgi:hypothetical protein
MRAMVEQMEAMQRAFQALQSPVLSPARDPLNVDQGGPEAAAGGSSGNSNSLNGPHGSAPADAK